MAPQQIPKTLQESQSKTQKIASKNQPNTTKKPTQSKIPEKCLCKPTEKPTKSHWKTQKNRPKQSQNNPVTFKKGIKDLIVGLVGIISN